MSRHAAPRGRRPNGGAAVAPGSEAPGAGPPLGARVGTSRRGHLVAAGIAAVLAVGLGVAAAVGREGVAAGVAVVQLLLVPAWVLGTGLPGRRGGSLIGLGAAAAADVVLLARDRTSLQVLLGVVALAFPVLLVHQLTRGVVRVRVTESLSGIALLVTAQVAAAAAIALTSAMDGPRLASAVLVAAAAGLAVAHLTDAVAPVPRLAEDVRHGLLAVALAVAAGAVAGLLHARGADQLTAANGAALGAAVAGVAALLAVGVGYVAATVDPRPPRAGPPALAYLSAGLPLALACPVGYLVALSVAG